MYCVRDCSHLYDMIPDKMLFSLKQVGVFLCLILKAICNLASQPYFVCQQVLLTFFFESCLFKISSFFEVWFHFCLFLNAFLDLFSTECFLPPLSRKSLLSAVHGHLSCTVQCLHEWCWCVSDLAFHVSTSCSPRRFCVLF